MPGMPPLTCFSSSSWFWFLLEVTWDGHRRPTWVTYCSFSAYMWQKDGHHHWLATTGPCLCTQYNTTLHPEFSKLRKQIESRFNPLATMDWAMNSMRTYGTEALRKPRVNSGACWGLWRGQVCIRHKIFLVCVVNKSRSLSRNVLFGRAFATLSLHVTRVMTQVDWRPSWS